MHPCSLCDSFNTYSQENFSLVCTKCSANAHVSCLFPYKEVKKTPTVVLPTICFFCTNDCAKTCVLCRRPVVPGRHWSVKFAKERGCHLKCLFASTTFLQANKERLLDTDSPLCVGSLFEAAADRKKHFDGLCWLDKSCKACKNTQGVLVECKNCLAAFHASCVRIGADAHSWRCEDDSLVLVCKQRATNPACVATVAADLLRNFKCVDETDRRFAMFLEKTVAEKVNN